MIAKAALRIVQLGCSAIRGILIGARRAAPAKDASGRLSRSIVGAEAILHVARARGGAFPKLAQILSTRPDLLGEAAASHLAQACAALDLKPRHSRVRQWSGRSDRRHIGLLGSGAIAETYLVEPRRGDAYVIKAKRPGIDEVLRADLALLNGLGRLVSRLGLFRALDARANLEVLTGLLAMQLDFTAERDSLAALHDNLSSQATVPRPLRTLTGGIAMAYLPRVAELTDAPVEDRAGLARTLMELVYRMIFIDGLIHCDLHPGNVFLGPAGAIAIVDAGFCSRITRATRNDFREFFLAIALKRTTVLAEVIVRHSNANEDPALTRRIARRCYHLIEKHAGRRAGEFRLVGFVRDLYAIYRASGLTMTTEFFSVIYALLVVEGLVLQLDPELDFQQLAFDFTISNRAEIFALAR